MAEKSGRHHLNQKIKHHQQWDKSKSYVTRQNEIEELNITSGLFLPKLTVESNLEEISRQSK